MDFTPLVISLKTAITATLFTFLVGTYAAWRTYSKKQLYAIILDGVFTLPLVLPPTVAGFFLLLLFGRNGPIGRILSQFHIQIVFTWSATVIAAVVISFPLMYRSAKAAFLQIDENLIYAARTLRMSESTIFFKILLPLAMPGILSGGILAFARALGEFGATLMIAGNIPRITQTIPVAIYMAVQGYNMKLAYTWVVIIVILSFIVIFTLNYCERKKRGKY
ncbi:molybdate ABC transporter permease subunit [Anaeromicropila herbilytica]|uniref:Molybdenum transport system permease n=1 Tax=Anaeromicropila herbilytica TaxID=2785025 RepID=A0A7R7IEQ4_9FIRM|nr:molybdate ABC transporter permease subunit [Anaeromicropila herbilytica]BCN32872.1 molybdenum ABC transporter permease subunit [Anaeromicropila herbilytica]